MSKRRVLGCKYCGHTGHFEFACFAKPKKPIKAAKRIKRIGKVTSKWIETRNKWLEQNKAEYYVCHYCPTIMTRSQLTLDHYKSRGRHPELRYVLHNLVPCCAPCNQEKGSLNGDEFIQKRKEMND
jgi:5-methylcytosine-specific restriction endonuclease McrA